MELLNNNKLNFIIDLFTDLDTHISGGLIALHRLAYELADEDHNVYIFCKPGYPHKNIHIIPSHTEKIEGHKFRTFHTPFSYPLNKTISIYPEHSRGSRFNTLYNVRWVMYHTTPKDEESFKEDDYIFNYESFQTITPRKDGVLTIRDYNLDKFFVENNSNRKGYCFIHGKETPLNYKEIISQYNSTDITPFKDQPDLNLLRKEFNKYEYFLTFDEKTYLTTASALCGCKAIILDINTNLTPLEYKLKNSLNMFGVAYGINDLEWAENTLHLVRNSITQIKEVDEKTVKNFIKFWEENIQL